MISIKISTLLACSFILAPLLPPLAAPGFADVGVGVGLEPWDGAGYYRKKEKDKRPDRFLLATGEFFGMKTEELVKLRNKGYGRNELIKILLLSRDSKQDLKEIVKLRDKNTKLAKIAEKYGLDYAKILDDAAKDRVEIDFRVIHSTYIIEVSTITEKTK